MFKGKNPLWGGAQDLPETQNAAAVYPADYYDDLPQDAAGPADQNM